MTILLQKEDEDAILDQIYYCTSTKEENDPNMKPNPGLILQALQDFDISTKDDNCVFIGDTITDLQAATAANIPTKILVSTGYGRSIMGQDSLTSVKMMKEKTMRGLKDTHNTLEANKNTQFQRTMIILFPIFRIQYFHFTTQRIYSLQFLSYYYLMIHLTEY